LAGGSFYSDFIVERYHGYDYGLTTLIKLLPERKTFNGSFDFYRVSLRDLRRRGILHMSRVCCARARAGACTRERARNDFSEKKKEKKKRKERGRGKGNILEKVTSIESNKRRENL